MIAPFDLSSGLYFVVEFGGHLICSKAFCVHCGKATRRKKSIFHSCAVLKQQLLLTKQILAFFSPSVSVCTNVCVLIVQGGPVNSVSLMTRKFVSTQEPFKPIIIWTSIINPRFIGYLGLDMLSDT